MPGFEAREFTSEEKREFEDNRAGHVEFRRKIERTGNSVFPLFLQNSDAQKQAFDHFSNGMREGIHDAYLKDKLVPQWSVGCRRLTPGVDYLESLRHPKSSVVYGEITNVTTTGLVMDDGSEHAVDVLICATGFDTTFKPRFALYGENDTTLAEQWASEPRSYLGIGAAGFPNYFMFLGPNSPVGNGPVLVGIESQADYFMKFINKMREENIKYVPRRYAAAPPRIIRLLTAF